MSIDALSFSFRDTRNNEILHEILWTTYIVSTKKSDITNGDNDIEITIKPGNGQLFSSAFA